MNKISFLPKRRPRGERRAVESECASSGRAACGAVLQWVCNIYTGVFPQDAPAAPCSRIPRSRAGDPVAASLAMPWSACDAV